MLSSRGLCDEPITRPEESYRLCCVVVCDLEISRMGAPYIYDISHLRVKVLVHLYIEIQEGRIRQLILLVNFDLNSTSWSRISVWFFFTSSGIEYPEKSFKNTLKRLCK